MARFQTAPDIWNPDVRAALDAGTLTLQPGQWIRLGERGQLSRFYRHNSATGHIVAFHGRDGYATRKMREYVAGQREADSRRALRAAQREAESSLQACGRILAAGRPATTVFYRVAGRPLRKFGTKGIAK